MTSKSWRDVLKVHPACVAGRRLSEFDLSALARRIQANGMVSPVAIWKDAGPNDAGPLSLLDGQNRLDALELAGMLRITDNVEEQPSEGEYLLFASARFVDLKGKATFDSDYTCLQYDRGDGDPWAIAEDLNVHRRHDDAEQRAEHAASLRERVIATANAAPEKSIRQIAKATGTTHPTASRIIKEAQAAGDVESFPRRTDTLGRSQPVERQKSVRTPEQPAAAEAPAGRIDFNDAGPQVEPEPEQKEEPITSPLSPDIAAAVDAFKKLRGHKRDIALFHIKAVRETFFTAEHRNEARINAIMQWRIEWLEKQLGRKVVEWPKLEINFGGCGGNNYWIAPPESEPVFASEPEPDTN